MVRRRPDAAWHRGRCGAGSTGERLYDGARLPWRAISGQRQRWRLARRSRSAPTEMADDVASGPPQTPLDELAKLAGVVSPQHIGPVGPCLLASAPGAGRGSGATAAPNNETRARVCEAAAALIPRTVPDVRRRLWWLVWGQMPTPAQVCRWAWWRRHHQALAKRCHDKRPAAPSY
jgi:hypothetical protein